MDRPGDDSRTDLHPLWTPALDPLFWPAARMGVESAWTAHVPFAHWIVAALQPRAIVELGTHNGVSYAAFCEAVQRSRLDCRCYAVDTWQGDEHAGHYGEEVYNDLRRFHDLHYAAFSDLLRCTFDQALDYVPDGSVDLLHIDGLHTYEAVRHDFEAWHPKLSDRAVVLFHDTNVRERGFGVWRYWAELAAAFPAFEFLHGHGLGVLCVGQQGSEAVRGLATLPDPAANAVRERFAFLGERWVQDMRAVQLAAHTSREYVALSERAFQASHRADQLGQDVARIEAEGQDRLARERQRAVAAEQEAESLRRDAGVMREQAAQAVAERDEATRAAEAARIATHAAAEAAAAHEAARLLAETDREQADRARADAIRRADTLSHSLGQAQQEAQVARAQLADTTAALRMVQSSTAWRATAPLRRTLDASPALGQVARRAVRAGKWGLVWRIPLRLRVRHAQQAEAERLTRSGAFDAGSYLAANPDVAASGISPALHWVRFGQHEGRHRAPHDAARAAAPQPGHPTIPYEAWIERHRLVPAELDLQRRLVQELPGRPLISILTPVYRVDAAVLDDTIRSVVAQTYPDWELCLAVGDTTDPARAAMLDRWAGQDPRICVHILSENGGISRNSDAALAMARGEWAVLLDHDDLLTPDALFELARAALEDPGAAMIYSDKDQVGADGLTRQHPLMKPAWSPDIMLNANYLTHLNMMRVDRLRAIGGWDPDTDGAQDWDLFFRAIGTEGRVRHVPRVLYHWRQVATSVAAGGFDAKPWAADGQVRAVTKHLHATGWPGASVTFDGPMLRVVWPPSQLSISLLVLPNGTEAAAPVFAWPGRVEIVAAPGALTGVPGLRAARGSPAAMLDALAAAATGDVLVVLDAGLALQAPEWLAELVGPLANPAIAAVAGATYRPDGTIDAMGAFCIDGEVRPGFGGLTFCQGGPFGNSAWYGNASAAPLRFLAMRRADWRSVAQHSVHGRADLSVTLALVEQGRRILLNPFAIATARRADPFVTTDTEALRTRFVAALPGGDPHVSPHLTFAGTGWLGFRAPREDTGADHNFAAEARYVAHAYDADAADIARSRAACAAAPAAPLGSVAWLVPPFAVPFYGGIYTILRTAEFMRTRHGVRPLFSVMGAEPGRSSPDAVRAVIAQAFPALAAAATIEILRGPDEPFGGGPVDALVSTLWITAYRALRAPDVRRKFYLVQDWEPLFYPAGSISGLVEATYRFGFHAICNTPALAESYRGLGGDADHFMPAVDGAVFHPRRGARPEGAPFRLFCYARPATPRNGFETLAHALRRLKERHGDGIDILTAGAEWRPEAHGLGGVVRHLGLLPYARTGELYRACDAGLVAMATRHPSYLPFELMASGAAVVTNRNPHTAWLLQDGVNASLCELTQGDVVRGVEAVMDGAFRARLVQGGIATIARGHADWDATCATIHGVLDRVCRE